ncbi:DUF4129 domain-containing protein [Leptolyngbya sp. NIES-2104]|uniref:DUF4129 domain-containing protein n=1 Tax=Leptolyngbya sp. NIES-2104 TaxID=1552121 RepID=UPI0006EC617C|nr:DUF4129 domain-containing protein [Leptolyngbya sp. NIES-2104]GAP98879.1 hypothetical protein NIES2104_54350 [Leptolyngbya sp. NIES-2104]
MAAEQFQKTDFNWQLQQFFRQVGEWIELNFPQIQPPNVPDPPNWSSWWLEAIFWTIIVLFVLWLGFQIYLAVRSYVRRNQAQIAKFLDRSATLEKELTIAQWVRTAQEFQQQGNYREASRALYMAMLQRLNETKLIPGDQSRTDREYSRLVQLLPQSESYQMLLEIHELLYFSNLPISAEMFDRVQKAYGNIERATVDMAKMA